MYVLVVVFIFDVITFTRYSRAIFHNWILEKSYATTKLIEFNDVLSLVMKVFRSWNVDVKDYVYV